ncbi:LIM domain only protein 3 [Galendromus occidentalis]|uniref:LIM domain only protein 3 n=1 Tax=Galendromus occidentalis TaxID=34638 RepID=A0AAJ6QNP6_9ACAR|nr:LIM domain only protein 3 [Galendromus occidentalis]
MEARVEPRSFHALTVSRWTNSTMSNGVVGASQGDELHCTGCQKPIRERYLLKALEQFWHEDCLKCACCECRLGEVGSTLFTKSNLILCKRDYLRLFGTTGLCCACEKGIPAFEMVMRAKGNVYHLDCFACQQCNLRFCVGDRFFLHENRILCETDYEAVRRNSTSNSPRLPLATLQQHTKGIDAPCDSVFDSR